MAPRVTHVAGRSHHGISRSPGKLVGLRRPVGRLGDRDAADQRHRAVAQSHTVLCEPFSESGAALLQDILGKAGFEVVEEDLSRVYGGIGERVGG